MTALLVVIHLATGHVSTERMNERLCEIVAEGYRHRADRIAYCAPVAPKLTDEKPPKDYFIYGPKGPSHDRACRPHDYCILLGH